MSDLEKLLEMFDRAGINYTWFKDDLCLVCGTRTGDGAEFYFDYYGNLIGGC